MVQLKSTWPLLNQIAMYRFVAILLLCVLGNAQTAPPSPVAPKPAVNLNDSDNARKARAVLDQTIQALGGNPTSPMKARVRPAATIRSITGAPRAPGFPTTTISSIRTR